MKRLIPLIFCLFLTGCALSAPNAMVPETAPGSTDVVQTAPTIPTETTPTEAVDPIDQLMGQLSLQEWVGQLLLARCNDETALADIECYNPAGFVLFSEDFEGQTPDTLRQKIAGYQAAAKVPMLLSVDEEGGTVTRISRLSAFRDTRFPSPRQAYSEGGMDSVLAYEQEKCALLSSLGLNVNLGPVCDITDDPNAFMYSRSLGQGVAVTGSYVSSVVSLYRDWRIGSVLKHFPGYGNNIDTHTGIAVDSRSLAQLEQQDLQPFRAGISAGCSAILVSHTIVQSLDPDLPASLSPVVHRYLREEMGFDGVILTDDLYMDAITQQYGVGEAAVMAVLAGNDLLCVTEYQEQYDAILEALYAGRIPFDTLEAAVRRVLEWKQSLGLL